MHSTEMPLGIFQYRISLWTLKLASITLSCFLYLQHKLWLKMVSVVVAKMSTSQTYQLFSMLHFLFQNYHACSGSTKQKSILIISFMQKSAQFSCPTTKINPICMAQNWPNLYGTKILTRFYCTKIDPIFANIWHTFTIFLVLCYQELLNVCLKGHRLNRFLVRLLHSDQQMTVHV